MKWSCLSSLSHGRMEGDHVCQGRASGETPPLSVRREELERCFWKADPLRISGTLRLRKAKATFCKSTCDLLELPHLRVSGKSHRLGSGKGSGQSSDTGIFVWLCPSPQPSLMVSPGFLSLARPAPGTLRKAMHTVLSILIFLFLLPRTHRWFTLCL